MPIYKFRSNPRAHVFGWGGLASMRRLCDSLNAAEHAGFQIPLHFFVDGGNLPRVVDIASDFQWNHGPKFVHESTGRLGLMNDIVQSWGPAHPDEMWFFFEDDVGVSSLHLCASNTAVYNACAVVSDVCMLRRFCSQPQKS